LIFSARRNVRRTTQGVSTVVINVVSVFRKTLINNRLCRHLCGAV